MKNIILVALISLFFVCGNIYAQQTQDGFELYEKGEYQKATEVLQKAVDADEKDRKAWLYLGMSYVGLNNKKAAVKSFEKADNINFKQELQANKSAVKFISRPRAGYTDEARRNSINGTVKLAVEFGADGQIKQVFPFQELPYGLTENAIKAVKKVRFEPATKDGKAVSYITIVSYSFMIY